jgi:hypothetical protein
VSARSRSDGIDEQPAEATRATRDSVVEVKRFMEQSWMRGRVSREFRLVGRHADELGALSGFVDPDDSGMRSSARRRASAVDRVDRTGDAVRPPTARRRREHAGCPRWRASG